MGNRTGGIDQAVSTVVLVLDSLLSKIKSEFPEIKHVYDEKLSYETAAEAYRANNNLASDTVELYPLFAFRRTVLRHSDVAGPGKRAVSIGAKRNVSDLERPKTSNVYGMVHGEFDINFLYITKSVQQLEVFEVLYMSEDGISAYKEIDVDLFSDLGESFNYFATYQPLEDKSFEVESVAYKMVQGTITVRGFYPVLRANAKHILEINSKIQDLMGPGIIYAQDQIKI